MSEPLDHLQKMFTMYKALGEKAMAQVPDERLFWTFANDSNSIAILVQHLSGNMLSRFTRFFEEDGEKPWRQRDREFEHVLVSRSEINAEWEKGWNCFFELLNSLSVSDLQRTITIRGEAMTAHVALDRQLAHYAYHVGQMVFLAKMLAPSEWKSLSIPKRSAVK